MGEILSLGLRGLMIPEQAVSKCCVPSSALTPPVWAGGDGEDLCSCVDVHSPNSLDCWCFIAPYISGIKRGWESKRVREQDHAGESGMMHTLKMRHSQPQDGR